jgi:hypothetical protein
VWQSYKEKEKEKRECSKRKRKRKNNGQQLITWHTMATKIIEGQGEQRALGDGNSGKKSDLKIK